MDDINNREDILDVRDIIARVEELEDARDEDRLSDEEVEEGELDTLTALLDAMKGYGGDEQWRGDWYPVTLIRDSHFEEAMDELLEDIGVLKLDSLPGYLTVTVNYAALQQDYSSVEFDGVTYWYR